MFQPWYLVTWERGGPTILTSVGTSVVQKTGYSVNPSAIVGCGEDSISAMWTLIMSEVTADGMMRASTRINRPKEAFASTTCS
jgi:hypothetical protein